MRHIIIVAAASLSVAACSGFFPGPAAIPLEFQSTPPGAEARTSMGQGCVTPCSVEVPAPEGDFTVSFTLANFQPMTIPVHITRNVGSLMSPPFTSLNPNPVLAQLQPTAPSLGRPKRKRATAQ